MNPLLCGLCVLCGVMSVLKAILAPPTMTVDRPFVFVIRDDETGGLLFMGRVVNPKATG